MHTKTWNVDIFLSEGDGRTHAEAVLRTHEGTEWRHTGVARKHPGDREVPEIGDELAVTRALSGLAHDLLEATVLDVQDNDPAGGAATLSED